ncbi:MAG: PspC domain-containing protein [Candidatus Delongbacteria bacterium]|nr:PspC domain-containing protein [Candidatus Delongbacteria bacterium]MCG2761351.1 PspC domain-containing protein [Candidatus Delongbacteria bacterium]
MRLTKSKKNSMFFGICGGIAEWIGWDPTLVRIAYVLASIFSAAFPGILIYIMLIFIMPDDDKV